jgi:hypothetical protein
MLMGKSSLLADSTRFRKGPVFQIGDDKPNLEAVEERCLFFNVNFCAGISRTGTQMDDGVETEIPRFRLISERGQQKRWKVVTKCLWRKQGEADRMGNEVRQR